MHYGRGSGSECKSEEEESPVSFASSASLTAVPVSARLNSKPGHS
jgi:hypothetical protein